MKNKPSNPRRIIVVSLIIVAFVSLFLIFTPKAIVPDTSKATVHYVGVRKCDYRNTDWPYKTISNYDPNALLNCLHKYTEYLTLYNVESYAIDDVDIEIHLSVNGKIKEILLGNKGFTYSPNDIFKHYMSHESDILAEIADLLDSNELEDTVLQTA